MSEIISNLVNAITYGGTVAIIGMLIVFIGLIILIVIVSMMAKIFERIAADAEAKKQAAEAAAAKAAADATAKAAAPAPAPVQETVAEEVTDDEELIAVIAAALAAFDNSGKTLVVRKVRRVSAWNKSSREEQICRF